MYCHPAIKHKSNEYDDKHEECDLCTTTQQCSPPAHSFMHNCRVMRQNHNQNLEPDLYPWCSLFLPAHTNTHFTHCKNRNPQVKKPFPGTFPGTHCGFILMIKEKTRHPQKKRRLMLALSFFPLPCLKLESKGRDPSGSMPFVIGCKLRSITWCRRSLRQYMEAASGSRAMRSCSGQSGGTRPAWKKKGGRENLIYFALEVSWLIWDPRWGSF